MNGSENQVSDPIQKFVDLPAKLFPDQSQLNQQFDLDSLVLFNQRFDAIYPLSDISKSDFKRVVASLETLMSHLKINLTKQFNYEENGKLVVCILVKIMNSQYMSPLAKELKDIGNSFILSSFTNYPHYRLFIPFLTLFFQVPELFDYFQQKNGIELLFVIATRANNNDMVEVIFNAFSYSLKKITDPKVHIKVIKKLAYYMNIVHPTNLAFIIEFLIKYFNTVPESPIITFAESEGLTNLNFVISQNLQLPSFLFYDSLINTKLEMIKNDQNVIVNSIIDLLPKFTKEKETELSNLLLILKKHFEFSKEQFTIDEKRFQILTSCNLSKETYDIFFEILFSLISKYKFDTKKVLDEILKYTTPSFILENEVPGLLRIIQYIAKIDHNVCYEHLTRIFQNSTKEEFIQIFEKYKIVPILFSTIFMQKSGVINISNLLTKFLKSDMDKTNNPIFVATICNILEVPSMPEMIVGFIASLIEDTELIIHILDAMTDFIHSGRISSYDLRTGLNFLIGLLDRKNDRQRISLFNLIAALSSGTFNQSYDEQIRGLFEKTDYFDSNEEEIRKLIYGISQDKEIDCEKNHICFPSLLSRLSDFKITSPYDCWVCAQFGIEKWLNDTKKDISEFPNITEIAKRFIKTKHAQMLFNNPILCSKSLGKITDEIPLFEFTRSETPNSFSLSADFKGDPYKSMSFWFMFKELPHQAQKIVQFRSAIVIIMEDQIYCSGKIICSKILPDQFYHLHIQVSEQENIAIYLNSALIHEYQGNPCDSIEIGSTTVIQSTWFIGGAIRFFRGKHNDIESTLYNAGIKCLQSLSIYEVAKYSALNFVNLETGQINRQDMPNGTMPVITMPLSCYLEQKITHSYEFFSEIYAKIEQKEFSYLADLIQLIAAALAKGRINFDKLIFVRLVSTLMNHCPQIFDKQLLCSIIQCLTDKNGLIIPNIFFQFFEDICIAIPQAAEELMDVVTPHFQSVTNVENYFRVLHRWLIHQYLNSTENSNYAQKIIESLFKLIKVEYKQDIVSNFIPLFHGNPLYDLYFKTLLDLIDSNFTKFYLFDAIQNRDGVSLMYAFVVAYPNCYPKEHVKRIMSICINNVDIMKSWSCVFSMMIGTKVDLEESMDFEFDQINDEVLPYFFIMLSILLAVHKSLTDKWLKLFTTSMKMLDLIYHDVKGTKFDIFAMINLLAFGKFTDKLIKYPFAPWCSTNEALMHFANDRSKKNRPGTIIYSDHEYTKDKTINDIHNLIKSEVNNNLPNDWEITYGIHIDHSKYIESLIETNSVDQREIIVENWAEFINLQMRKFTQNFEEFTMESCIPFLDSIQFVVNFLVTNFEKPNFLDLFSNIFYSVCLLSSEQAKVVVNKIVFNLLTECSSKGLYNFDLLNFLANRFYEGWLGQTLAPMLSFFLLILKQANVEVIPKEIKSLLLKGFDLIQPDQYHIFVELFVNFSDYIFSEANMSNSGFIVLTLHYIISQYAFYPESFIVVIQKFYEKLLVSKSLRENWLRNQNLEALDFKIFVEIIKIWTQENGLEAYSKWEKENREIFVIFSNIRLMLYENFVQVGSSKLEQSINEMLKSLEDSWDSLNAIGDELIKYSESRFLVSTAILEIVHTYYQEQFSADISLYQLLREEIMCNNKTIGKIKSKQTGRPNISGFSVPQLEVDLDDGELPIENDVKSFIKDDRFVQHMPGYNFMNKNGYRRFLLTFTSKVALSPVVHHYILRALLNNGKEFLASTQGGMIYSGISYFGNFYISTDTLFYYPIKENDPVKLNTLIGGFVGDFISVEGLPLLSWSLSDILYVSHSQAYINIFFVNGYHFLLTLETKIITQIANFLEQKMKMTLESLPGHVVKSSPFSFVRFLNVSNVDLESVWIHFGIDNYTLVRALNYKECCTWSGPNFFKSPQLKIGAKLAEGMFNEHYINELNSMMNLHQWVNANFNLNFEAKLSNQPPVVHLMSNPRMVFWHHIIVNKFTPKPKSIQVSDDKVIVFTKPSFIVPPANKQVISLDSESNQILLIPLTDFDRKAFVVNRQLYTVSCFSMSSDAAFIALGHIEGFITIHRLIYNELLLTEILQTQKVSLKQKIDSIAISSTHFLAFAAHENVIDTIAIANGAIINSLNVDFVPLSILIDDYAANMILVGKSKFEVYNFSGRKLRESTFERECTCATIAQLQLGVSHRFFVTGHANGIICFWEKEGLIRSVETGLEDIAAVCIDSTSQRVAFCTSTKAFVLSFFGNTLRPLIAEHADTCCVCGARMTEDICTCKSCHRFICQKCFQKKIGFINMKSGYCTDCQQLL